MATGGDSHCKHDPESSWNVYEEMRGGRVESQHTRRDLEVRSSGPGKRDNRHYRLAAVCLGLSCVFLLTAVILLCIKFNQLASERDQLQTSYAYLTPKRDQLQISYTNLTTELQMKLSTLKKTFEEGWRYFNSNVYFISTERRNWSDSREDCREKGAELVIINSRQEQEFVDSLSVCKDAAVFIGLTDRGTEGVWRWVDGSEPSIEYWVSGQPNNGGWRSKQDCVVTGPEHGKRWNDKPCEDLQYWICEKKLGI